MNDNSLLNTWAALFEDQQAARIALGLRIRDMRKQEGRWNDLVGAPLEEALKETHGLEDLAERRLKAAVKQHRLGPFITSTAGLGHASIGRLLAQIGDPSWHSADDRPRTLDELNAYCGMAVVDGTAPRIQRGKQANWNDTSRKLLFVIASRCIMEDGAADKNGRGRSRSPYRDVYDAAREKYADAVHAQPCPRCGTKREVQEDGTIKRNVPAPIGSPLSDNHQHARARRLVAKAILHDLWRTDRDTRIATPKKKLLSLGNRKRLRKAA